MLLFDPDKEAARVSEEFRRAYLDGVIIGLEDWDVSPIELSLIMGLAFADTDINKSRTWKLSKWVQFIKRWIQDRAPIEKAYRPGGESKGATAAKAFPNWLKPPELEAWKYVRERAGLRITGIEDAVRAKLRSVLADTISLGLPRDKLIDKAVERLTPVFDGTEKDVKRIVTTELQAAFNDGVIVSTVQAGKTKKAAVVPQKDACQKCKDAFLDKSGSPKVFDVKDLMSGAVPRPPLHPNCRCVVVPIPPGKSFDANWNLV